MRTRPDHREAVARRLELLRAELDPDAALPGQDARSGHEESDAPVEPGEPDEPGRTPDSTATYCLPFAVKVIG